MHEKVYFKSIYTNKYQRCIFNKNNIRNETVECLNKNVLFYQFLIRNVHGVLLKILNDI